MDKYNHSVFILLVKELLAQTFCLYDVFFQNTDTHTFSLEILI